VFSRGNWGNNKSVTDAGGFLKTRLRIVGKRLTLSEVTGRGLQAYERKIARGDV